MSVAIEVEDLSKRYRLGNVGYSSLRDDMASWYGQLLRKGSLQGKTASTNDRTSFADSNFVWSLQDVSFSVNQGDVVGIIGKNGAGKSTLLKILSRVTSPTKGQVRVNGRIASLLEVGTGFHPELTGRENIYLNGAILGMRKQEIRSKFDEIVAFAGVERYIDTPVKRYSSGMYVRLAFAVAAHLEPEILIVDEVLAVGDAEFQKKCLGKMKDVSANGRTILFVSHNLTAIQSLCNKGLLMQNGLLRKEGSIEEILHTYSSGESFNLTNSISFEENFYKNAERIIPLKIQIEQEGSKNGIIDYSKEFSVNIHFENINDTKSLNLSLVLKTSLGEIVFNSVSEAKPTKKGRYSQKLVIPKSFLNHKQYTFDLYFIENQSTSLLKIEEPITFEIQDSNRNDAWYGEWIGVVHPELKWSRHEI